MIPEQGKIRREVVVGLGVGRDLLLCCPIVIVTIVTGETSRTVIL